MDTKNFRTKTEFMPRNNGKIPGIWEIALDLGYSSVKLFSPNTVSSFPSYARRVNDDFQYVSTPPKESILFKDLNTEELWLVGEVAQNTMATGDTSDSETSLYGRERYTTAMFDVIAKTGLGLGMLKNQYGDPKEDKIVVQTGLPERYMSDTDDLIEALAGRHSFALKIGGGDWVFFDFTIDKSNVYVMSQPKGTLFSICVRKDGTFHPDAEKYLTSSVLVFDPGFGTLDLFPIVSGTVGHGETYSDLGMKRVMQETSKLIKENYGANVPVPAMQKCLETGMVKYVNKKTFEASEKPFKKFLLDANEKVCEEAIRRMTSAINLIDYDYLVVTGGTSAAWLDYIKEKFKNFSTLKIINGNQNDDLSFIYSNVRGYYFNRKNKLNKEYKEANKH